MRTWQRLATHPLLAVTGVVVAVAPSASAQPAVPGVGVELEVLTTEVTDPTNIEVAEDGRVIIAERTGRIKAWQQDGSLTELGRIQVGANSCDDCAGDLPQEGGLHGLLLAADFAATGHLYAYYSVPGSLGVAPTPAKHPDAGGATADEGLFRLSRFTVTGDGLDPGSEQPLLENPAFWSECCHYGGDLEWLPDGTIVLSTGDDTNPHESNGFAPRDERTGRDAFNAERTAQNPADRRGKLLRLNPDGSIPDGSDPEVAVNPYVNDPAYDPAVYAMGLRSPYRIEVHAPSGSVIVGNVGPDAFAPDSSRGPAGHDELEFIPAGGGTNHGWPRCIGDNKPYVDFDFETGESGQPLSCDGMTPAAMYYPYAPSAEFPAIGAGLRAIMPGPVYDHDSGGSLALPGALFADRLIIGEFMRNTLYTLPVDANGASDTAQLTPFHAGTLRTIDLELGPDGAVYLAEYGSLFYGNTDSRISRLKCLGCQPDAGDYRAR